MNNGFVKSASARTIDVNFFIEYDIVFVNNKILCITAIKL
jgi:hypothetical protein